MNHCLRIILILLAVLADTTFARKTKRSCSKPDPVANAVLLPNFQNVDTFDHREKIKYVCKDGFATEGDGDTSIECRDGDWTDINFSCIAKEKEATCAAPVGVTNAELREEYRNKEVYDVGEKVAYDCTIGYTIAGRSRERECIGPNWSEVQFTCDVIRCPYLPTPENGQTTLYMNSVGEKTYFKCNLGYRLSGQSELLCRIDGRWSPPDPPKCEPIFCPELHSLGNGNIFQDSSDGIRNNYRSVAVYTCNYGFSINGTTSRSISRRCQADGTWEGYNYFCDVLKCQRIDNFYGGTVQYLGSIERMQGSYAFYMCNEGSCKVPDVSDSECQRNTLVWKPEPPKCYKVFIVHCPAFSRCYGKEQLCQNEEVDIQCDDDYELYDAKTKEYLGRSRVTIYNDNGTAVVRLEGNKKLEDLPTCVEKRCESRTFPHTIISYATGSYNGFMFESGESHLLAKCKDGYEIKNNGRPIYTQEILCRKGIFYKNNNQKFGDCTKGSCIFHDFPQNEHTIRKLKEYKPTLLSNDDLISHGETIVYECQNEGYEFYVSSTNRYLSERSFEATCRLGTLNVEKESFPVCIEKRCSIDVDKIVCYKTYSDKNACRNQSFKLASGSFVDISCPVDYELFENNLPVESGAKSSRCNKGQLESAFTCKPKRCSVPALPDHVAPVSGVNEGQLVDSGITILVDCQKGYHFTEEYSKNIQRQVTTMTMELSCKKGNWSNTLKDCQPNGCLLKVDENSVFWSGLGKVESIDKLIGESGLWPNGTVMNVKCKEGFILHSEEKGWSEQHNQSATCVVGKWMNAYTCGKEPCKRGDVRVRGATLSGFDDRPFIESGQTITAECNNGYHFTETYYKPTHEAIYSGKQELRCNQGKWIYSISEECQPNSCKLNIYYNSIICRRDEDNCTIVDENGFWPNGTVMNVSCIEGFSLVTLDTLEVLSEQPVQSVTCFLGTWTNAHSCKRNGTNDETRGLNEFSSLSVFSPSTQTTWASDIQSVEEGCTLPTDQRFRYQDPEENILQAGSKIANGTILTVSCTELDLYEYYKDEDYFEKTKVVCTNGILVNNTLLCPETDSHQCKELKNGKVSVNMGSLKVSCNDGYKLNLYGESNDCICKNEGLMCKYDQIPECTPEPCQIPLETDSEVTIYKKENNGEVIHLSKGLAVNDSNHVFFHCLGEKLEPQNRRFLCDKGKWVEDDEDNEWKLGNAGEYPTCRLASCRPKCENDGVCIKDDTCKCPHLTAGYTCETILCDEACNVNGGECVTPGECGNCPPGKYGVNCRNSGCQLPFDSERVSPVENWVGLGREINSKDIVCPNGHQPSINSKTVCMEYGRWSQEINCVPIEYTQFRIQVQTGFDWRASTGADVYIILHGEMYSTRKLTLKNGVGVAEMIHVTTDVEDITPIVFVMVGRESLFFQDDWQVDHVAITDLKRQRYNMFKHTEPVWVHDDRDIQLNKTAECDYECIINGGKCSSIDICYNCPAGRYGFNCREYGCTRPVDVPTLLKNEYPIGYVIQPDEFNCRENTQPFPATMTCLQHGLWTQTTRCRSTGIKYVIQIKTGSHDSAGSATSVFVTLHGDGGLRTERLQVRGSYDRDALAEDNLYAIDVIPIRYITVEREGGDGWQMEYVSIFIEATEGQEEDQYYVFRDVSPWWIQEGELKNLNSYSANCVNLFRYSEYYPFNNGIRGVVIARGKDISERTCKQKCVLEKSFTCIGVYYETRQEHDPRCFGFNEIERKSFRKTSRSSRYFDRYSYCDKF